MRTATLKAAPGRFVRDPVTRIPLAAEGEAKELDTFWSRRLKAGDVVEIDTTEIVQAPVPDPKPADASVTGIASGYADAVAGAETEKTTSRRARRAASAEE